MFVVHTQSGTWLALGSQLMHMSDQLNGDVYTTGQDNYEPSGLWFPCRIDGRWMPIAR